MGVVAVSLDHVPTQSGDEDTSQFDSRFTKLTPFDSPVDAKLSESVNLHFKVNNYVYSYSLCMHTCVRVCVCARARARTCVTGKCFKGSLE